MFPPQSQEEREALTESLKRFGCHDAILVGKDGKTIISGHNRYEVCQKEKIDFEVRTLELDSREDIEIFMRLEQAGKRQLSGNAQAANLGRLYNLMRDSNGNGNGSHDTPPKGKVTRLSATNGGVENAASEKPSVAKKLADKSGVSERAVLRASAYAKALDSLAAPVRTTVENFSHQCSQAGVIALSKLDKKQQASVMQAFKQGEALSAAIKAVKAVEAPVEPAKPKREPKKKSAFNDGQIEQQIGSIIRLLDKRAAHYGEQNCNAHRKCLRLAGSLLDALREWRA